MFLFRQSCCTTETESTNLCSSSTTRLILWCIGPRSWVVSFRERGRTELFSEMHGNLGSLTNHARCCNVRNRTIVEFTDLTLRSCSEFNCRGCPQLRGDLLSERSMIGLIFTRTDVTRSRRFRPTLRFTKYCVVTRMLRRQ